MRTRPVTEASIISVTERQLCPHFYKELVLLNGRKIPRDAVIWKAVPGGKTNVINQNESVLIQDLG